MVNSRSAILIAEYKETGAYVRYYDRLIWIIGGIFLPTVFGCAFYYFKTDDLITKILLVFGSLLIVWYWSIIGWKYHWYQQIRLERAREIEMYLGMWQHRSIHNKTRLKGMSFLNFHRFPISYLRLILACLITEYWVFVFLKLFTDYLKISTNLLTPLINTENMFVGVI